MGKIVTLYLSDGEASELKEFCNENQCTQYSALKTALRELLYKPMKKIEEEPMLLVESETVETETLEIETQKDKMPETESLENHTGENEIPEEKRQIDDANSLLRRFIKTRTQKE